MQNSPNPQQGGYVGGYQQQPVPPQQQYYPPQQPQQIMYPPSQPQMMYPYPQQMIAPQMNVNVNIGNQRPQQHSMLVRLIYFCFVGWWLGLFWLSLALGFMASIIGLPIGLLMINRLGAVMTLSRR